MRFKVLHVDTFDGDECVLLETDDRAAAIAECDKYQGAQMTRVYVYDREKPSGWIHARGTY